MTNYEEYLIIDNKIKELKDQKENLRTNILNEMIKNKKQKEVTPVGTFSVAKLKTWTYTDKVKILGENFKAQKAKEESTGEATFVEKESLKFTGLKL